MAKTNITDAWLAKRVLPDGVDREKWWDDALPGFGVIVGRRFSTFIVQHRVNGKQRLETVGRFGRPGAGEEYGDAWTVTRARKRARELLGQMSAGIEPEDTSEEPTLRDAFKAHEARLRKKGRSEATIATLKKSMPYVEDWLDRPISELTGADLVDLHERIKSQAKQRANARNEKGAPLANRVIANISVVWNTLNKKLEGRLGTWNPAAAVDKDTLKPKRTRISTEALPGWYARVQTMTSPIQRDGLLLALFTGLRHEDVRTIRLEHVDFDAATLRLPDPKGGEARAFTIPLSQTCLGILKRRQETNSKVIGRPDGGWAFPAINAKGEVGPISDLRQQVHDGKQHSRFPAEDVHTLRRTYESVAHEAGVSELDQHVLTNHAYGTHNVNATYIAQHLDHLAACQDSIERALWSRIKPDSATKAKQRRARMRAV